MKAADLRIGSIYEMRTGILRRIEGAVYMNSGKPASQILDNDVEWTRVDPQGVRGRGPHAGRCWAHTFARSAVREIPPDECGVIL